MSDLLRVLETLKKQRETPAPITAPGVSEVSDSTIIHPLREQVRRRNFLDALSALQQQLPGVPIMPVPDFSRLVVANGANYVEDVNIKACQMVMFISFTSGLYFVSFGNRVNLPLPTVGFSNDYPRDSIVAPTGIAFYSASSSSVSVGIVNDQDVVSVIGWTQVI